MRKNPPKKPLRRISGLTPAERLKLQDDLNQQCIDYAPGELAVVGRFSKMSYFERSCRASCVRGSVLAIGLLAAQALFGTGAALTTAVRCAGSGTQDESAIRAATHLAGSGGDSLYPAGSKTGYQERIRRPEKYNMTGGVPGRIASIVNIHNRRSEVPHPCPRTSTRALRKVIVVAGGGIMR
ncbi:MAG: hypothetical protein R2724_10345 [Bryobacterales bacterium]